MLVMVVRLITPILILRQPLLGGIICVVLDYVDYDLIRWFAPEYLGDYQLIDKWLDLYYLLFEVYIVTLWKDQVFKRVTLGLFIFRLVGIVLFEITQDDKLLFLFPNFFEVMFLYYLIFKGRWPVILVLVFIWKIWQEYYLHMVQADSWINHSWNYLKNLSNL